MTTVVTGNKETLIDSFVQILVVTEDKLHSSQLHLMGRVKGNVITLQSIGCFVVNRLYGLANGIATCTPCTY